MKQIAKIATIAGLTVVGALATENAQAINTKGRSTVGTTNYADPPPLTNGGELRALLTLWTFYSENAILSATSGLYRTRLMTGCGAGQLPQDTGWFNATTANGGYSIHFCPGFATPSSNAGSIDDL